MKTVLLQVTIRKLYMAYFKAVLLMSLNDCLTVIHSFIQIFLYTIFVGLPVVVDKMSDDIGHLT